MSGAGTGISDGVAADGIVDAGVEADGVAASGVVVAGIVPVGVDVSPVGPWITTGLGSSGLDDDDSGVVTVWLVIPSGTTC